MTAREAVEAAGLAEAGTCYRNQLAREMSERGRRDTEADNAGAWRRIAAPAAHGTSCTGSEERRGEPAGREHVAGPRPGGFPGRGARPGQEPGAG